MVVILNFKMPATEKAFYGKQNQILFNKQTNKKKKNKKKKQFCVTEYVQQGVLHDLLKFLFVISAILIYATGRRHDIDH